MCRLHANMMPFYIRDWGASLSFGISGGPRTNPFQIPRDAELWVIEEFFPLTFDIFRS